MSWVFQPASEAFEELRKDWDALNRSQHNHILLDSGFVAPLVRHFGGRDVILGMRQNGGKAGMVLLVRNGRAAWETFQPSQAPLGLIVLNHQDEEGESLLELLENLPGYPLQLGVRQQDPDYSRFPPVSPRPDIQVLEYVQTARLPLEGTFESFWESRSINLKHNLARQRRRLAEQGHRFELVAHRDPASVAACLREYGRLESQGWKAKEGTAVTEDNVQGRAYREILETFWARGEGVVYQFLLDGKVIASDLCLARNGMLVVLKTAYDDSVERISAALLMRQEIVRQLYAEKEIRVIEFYGRVRDWHTKWTSQIRTMFHVNCFRHRWVPRVKELVKRFAA